MNGSTAVRESARALRHVGGERWLEVLLLQASPLLGAAFGGGGSAIGLGRLATLLVGSVLITAHVFVFNDWAGHHADLKTRAARLTSSRSTASTAAPWRRSLSPCSPSRWWRSPRSVSPPSCSARRSRASASSIRTPKPTARECLSSPRSSTWWAAPALPARLHRWRAADRPARARHLALLRAGVRRRPSQPRGAGPRRGPAQRHPHDCRGPRTPARYARQPRRSFRPRTASSPSLPDSASCPGPCSGRWRCSGRSKSCGHARAAGRARHRTGPLAAETVPVPLCPPRRGHGRLARHAERQ